MIIPANKKMFIGMMPSFEIIPKAELINILSEAEKKFGDRNNIYEIIGIKFHEFLPQIKIISNKIEILLSKGALSNSAVFIYQLSHEAVHLLSPTSFGNVSFLEEGIATHFATEYTNDKK